MRSKDKKKLADECKMKDLGTLRYFLEMEVVTSKQGTSMSQRKYALDLLNETSMLGCKLVDTPVYLNLN